MTKVNKNDVNQIFGVNAPDQDKPPYFNNYTTGWGEARTNNGKPTIKGFNFLQQRTDQNLLWIHQNGGALPYDASIDYVDGSIVMKDGKLQKLDSGSWVDYVGSYTSDLIPVESIDALKNQTGSFAKTLSYYAGKNKGAASYYYDSSQASVNNSVTIINGWCLENYLDMDTINCFVAGFKADGSDETALAKKCFNDLGLQVEIPSDTQVSVSYDIGLETIWACGLGTINWLNFDKTKDMERVAGSNVYPIPFKHNKTYEQTQFATVKGALGGKNVGQRFEVNSDSLNNYTFNNMSTLINYGGADVVGSMLKVTDAIATTYSNCTYTASTVQCDGFKGNTSISAGDYIRAGTNLLGVVYSINTTTGTITLVDGWGNTDTKELNVTPTSDMSCVTPIAYRIWARNDYVSVRANNSTIYNAIGYEMDVIAGHNLTDSVGFLAVAFGTDTCVSAFRSGRGTQTWWYAYHVPKNSAKTGLYIESGATFGLQHGAQYTSNSITVYSSQAYKGVKVTYAKESGLDVDNTPTAVVAKNVSVGLDVGGSSDTGLQFNGTNGNAKAVATQTNSGYLLHSNISGLGNYTMSSTGQENRTRKVVTNVTSDTTLSRDNSTNMITLNGSVANVSFSQAFQGGEIVEIKSFISSNTLIRDQGGSTIATLNSTDKSYGRFLFTGGSWFALYTA